MFTDYIIIYFIVHVQCSNNWIKIKKWFKSWFLLSDLNQTTLRRKVKKKISSLGPRSAAIFPFSELRSRTPLRAKTGWAEQLGGRGEEDSRSSSNRTFRFVGYVCYESNYSITLFFIIFTYLLLLFTLFLLLAFFCGSVPIYFNWSDSKVFGGSRVTFFLINISKNNDAQFKVGPICKSNYRRKSPSLRLHIVFVKDNSIINLAYMMLLFEELLEKKIFG